MKTVMEIKQEICEVGKKLWLKGFVAANDGNISVKVGENEFYCTPTGVSKGDLTPDMIIKVDKDGNKLEGELNPSSEIKMHMRVYRDRPDVCAVVHAHPPIATAFTVANIKLDQYILPEAVLTLAAVPTCVYGTPSTMEIPDSLNPYLQKHDAFLLENHGALTVGCDLKKAFFLMEEVEFNAVICKNAMDLGAVHEIPYNELEKLMDLRKRMKLTGCHPGIEKKESTVAFSCSKEELVNEIVEKVLAALKK